MFLVRDSATLKVLPPATPPPKLLERVRTAIRARHYSIRTKEAYVGWIRRFILFHGKRHPAEMAEAEINQFLSDLAVRKNVAASTQNQATLGNSISLSGSTWQRARQDRWCGAR